MLVLGASGGIVVGVRVRLLMPVAGGVGDHFPFLGHDLGGYTLFDREGLLFSDLVVHGDGNVDHDRCLDHLGDHDLFLELDHLR